MFPVPSGGELAVNLKAVKAGGVFVSPVVLDNDLHVTEDTFIWVLVEEKRDMKMYSIYAVADSFPLYLKRFGKNMAFTI